MDCEKFEPLLLDELYEELDELTSAAVKRHVSGCARCGSVLNGMRATRRLVSLPLIPVPVGLEDRILAAAREAQKVVPIKSRAQRVLSIAGSWAMRPQTAMAAVFLLMIGTSAFLIRSNKNYASREGAAVDVTVAGNPAPVAQANQSGESLDDKAAAAAHGPTPPNITRPPVATATASAVAMAEGANNNGPVDTLTAGAARDGKSKGGASAADESSLASAFGGDTSGNSNNRGRQGGPGQSQGLLPAPTPAPTNAYGGAPPPAIANAGPPAGAPDGLSQSAQKPMAPTKRSGPTDKEAQDPFSLGAAAFRARNFAEATRQFDAAAQSGDPNAALWAAESTREGQGCAVALGRFDSLSQKAAGSWVGHEASLRAARCQIAMSQHDPARDRLNKLTQVPSHAQAAQQALAELAIASKKPATGSGAGGAAAAAPRRAAPAAAPRPAPARAPNESEQKKDRVEHGF